MTTIQQGFRWLTVEQLLEVSPFKSKSRLYEAIRRGDWPPLDRIGGRSLQRSDVAAEANEKHATRAEADRAERERQASERSKRLVEARRAVAA
jgi:hypothetical protein